MRMALGLLHERLAVCRNEVLRVARLAARIARPCFCLQRAEAERRERARRSVQQLLEAIEVLLLRRRAGVKQVQIVVRLSAAGLP